MLVGQLCQTLEHNLIFLQSNSKRTSAGSVLLKEMDGEDKVQPIFSDLSEECPLPPVPAQLSAL